MLQERMMDEEKKDFGQKRSILDQNSSEKRALNKGLCKIQEKGNNLAEFSAIS